MLKHIALLTGIFCLAMNLTAPPSYCDDPGQPPEPSTQPQQSDGDSTQEFDIRVPRWQQLRPKWGFEAVGSPVVFHESRASTDPLSGVNLLALQFEGEYLPLTTEKFGVLGFGPSAALYYAPNNASNSYLSLWSVGAQVRYQARYFHNQIVVPTVAYEAEYWSYGMHGISGHVIATGPALGAMFFLNDIDPMSATGFYTEYGISRSYLIVEARKIAGTDKNISLGGVSYFFGLRFEL